MDPETPARAELTLYAQIYRCEACSHFTAPGGVGPFAQRGSNQTIPVSHFGNITQSPIWLILNNPKGDYGDLAVSTKCAEFGVKARSELSDSDVLAVRQRFGSYFNTLSDVNAFFEPWRLLLDGLRLGQRTCSFESGLICAVDLIKCPTAKSWMGYVMTDEGKAVWDNCLRRNRENRFLLRQIQLHRPQVLIFAGTQSCVGRDSRGDSNRTLKEVVHRSGSSIVENVWAVSRDRLSVGLVSQRRIGGLDHKLLATERGHLQTLIDTWSST